MADWYALDKEDRINILKPRLASGISHKKIAIELGTHRKTIQGFCKRNKLAGLSQGAQPENKNAEIHGLGRNTIARLAKRIVIEDGRETNLCENCGWKVPTGDLPIHHIDRDRGNNHPKNLKVLCQSCHNKEHEDDTPRGEDGRYQKATFCLGGGLGGE